MTADEARKEIEKLKEYIEFVDQYEPETMEQQMIHLYVQNRNVNAVAKELSERGFRMGRRKLVGKDVTNVIKAKPADPLHELAKKAFNSNKKRIYS